MDDRLPTPLRIDAATATVLREAYFKIVALPRGDHYALYDYVRAVVFKIAPVDSFYIGLLQGRDRVRYPYGYEFGRYDDPATHTFGPRGPTAWLVQHRTTYRYAYDNGHALNGGVMSGDVTRRSADAVIAPFLRPGADGQQRVFGMLSAQSYTTGCYDAQMVRAIEWVAALLARTLRHGEEDRAILHQLPAGTDTSVSLTADHVIEHLSAGVASIRLLARDPDEDPVARLAEVEQACERLQSELMQLSLQVDDGPERRFNDLLTPAEQELALLLAQGMDNHQLARDTGRALSTVKTHVQNIVRKYAMNRTQVAEDVLRYLRR